MAIPLIIIAGKALGYGLGIGAGADLYRRGKALIQEHGPVALGAAESTLDTVKNKVLDILDPADISGQRKQREDDALAEQHDADTRRAKARLTKEQKANRSKVAKLKKAFADKLRAAEDKASAALRAVEAKVAKGEALTGSLKTQLQHAKSELRRAQAARNAVQATQALPEDHPIQDLMGQVIATIAEGGHLPDEGIYQDAASTYGVDLLQLPPEEAEAAFANEWQGVL